MAETYTQQSSPMRFKAEALEADDLLLTGFTGTEALSRLYTYELELAAPLDKPAKFEDVLGKAAIVAIEILGGETRYFHGLVSRFSQGSRDENFIAYRLELVPQMWFLTRRVQSRIFQHVSVPDILKKVFDGFDVAYQLQGMFEPRDYCVQYRESDFDFASRLMEEEGMYYYFRHTEAGCEMVVANAPAAHDPVADPATLIFDETEGGIREEGRITEWEKVQSVRSGKVTLWDHCFELPDKHLEADQKIQETVAVGAATHKLSLNGVDKLELYDYPGGYAGRFDGINRGGAEQPAELEKIFEDNRRTARLRIQEQAAGAVTIEGKGDCRQMAAGHKFTVERHFDADGEYVLTQVTHSARIGGDSFRSGGTVSFEYDNTFQCIPLALPFRPERVTPRPTVRGTQTATVVGPAKEEIFTDRYGRVKVQFHWDREGKHDADSSCWIRVGTPWAGKQWGMIHIPRIGQEVIVDFLEGDPDQPIVIGSVWNAEQMPPYTLPANQTQSGVKSRSSKKGTGQNYNEIMFEDKKGEELVRIHAEKDMSETVENNFTRSVGGGLDGDPKKVGKSTTTVYGDHSLTVQKGDLTVLVEAGKAGVTVNKEIEVTSKTSFIHLDSPTEIKLTVKGSSITITPDTITLHAQHIKIEGTTDVKTVTPDLNMEGSTQAQLHGKKVTVDGTAEAAFQSSSGPASYSAKTKATLGVGNQTVLCDTAKVAVSGAMVKSAASGTNEITGAMVKIN
jgi:type VI secretion system secreted protein VgrG